jgi:hypothetical protein
VATAWTVATPDSLDRLHEFDPAGERERIDVRRFLQLPADRLGVAIQLEAQLDRAHGFSVCQAGEAHGSRACASARQSA